MRTVYEAANAIEAHMLLDLLRQQGLTAQILGEHLQGGIGELPAAGLVRLVIDESDYAAARAVIDRWETTQPAELPRPPARVGGGGRGRFTLGVVAGVVASWLVCQWLGRTEAVDPAHDALLSPASAGYMADTAGVQTTREFDRKLDGKVDFVGHYDAAGQITSAEADDDHDGVFETRMKFRDGMVELYEVDTDGDGVPDRRLHFERGMMTKTEILDQSTGLPVRVEYYRLGVLVKAEVDTDHDGRLDTRFFYTPLGEVASSESMDP